MTIKQGMIYKAGRARKILGDSASQLVINYVRGKQNPDGGFRGRSQKSDLYYTVFGVDCLVALNSSPQFHLDKFISCFDSFERLDFVHLCSFIHLVSTALSFNFFSNPTELKERFTENIPAIRKLLESYRSDDGGYSVNKNSKIGSIYGCFLAVSAFEEIGLQFQDYKIVDCIISLATPDGGFSNEPGLKEGTTTATSAALILLKKFGKQIPKKSGDWLLKMLHPSGGFLASFSAPIPDLLSTATALHCLAEIGYNLEKIRENCLDFIDTLWSNEGAFYGNWAENKTDVEYTFYGLLSIGNLY